MTPTIPTRAVLHCGLRRTVTRAIPGRATRTANRAMPCAFVARVTVLRSPRCTTARVGIVGVIKQPPLTG